MKVVYMGTPEAAVPPLAAIRAEGHEVVAVVCQPDRPKGRGKTVRPPEVKVAACSMGLKVLQPERASEPSFLEAMKELAPDIAVVMAYGQKIPSDVLGVPKLGFLNIHASLLPAYRGAAPVQRAIMDGLDKTGVTIMYMSEGMDEGDIGLQAESQIEQDDDSGTVLARLSMLGAELIVKMLRLIETGDAPRRPQDSKDATAARKITVKDEVIDWNWTRRRVVDHVRALQPCPGARFALGGNDLKICRARALEEAEAQSAGLPGHKPGLAYAASNAAVFVSASDGWVELLEVKPSGGKAMECRAYSRGRRLKGAIRTECANQ